MIDRIVNHEPTVMQHLRTRTQPVETYIQETSGSSVIGRDHYFLGCPNFMESKRYAPIEARSSAPKGLRLPSFHDRLPVFATAGFAQMIFLNTQNFNSENYSFRDVRRESEGGFRCPLFETAPADQKATGRFISRI
jgi:hypothetical protein